MDHCDNDSVRDAPPSSSSQPEMHSEMQSSEPLKKRRLSSSVWEHFRMLPQKPGEKLQCECIKCGHKYLVGSENGTSTSSIDVLEFWMSQQYRYPDLARFARDILCVPITTVASESAFSLSGRLLDQYRSSMTPETVEALICSRDWLYGEKALDTLNMKELTRDIMEINLNSGEDDSNDDRIIDRGSSNLG